MANLRPDSFDSYIGQEATKKNIKVCIEGALKRSSMDLGHILLSGGPGLGKTSLARIIAKELSVDIFELIGPRIESADVLDEIFSKIKSNDLIFIDEIHRLKPATEELLYAAMEDFTWQGKKLPKFTLIGATTRENDLTRPFRDRFTIIEQLSSYSVTELQLIIIGTAGKLNFVIYADAAEEIARRSRGVPRLANQHLLRVRDYAADNTITLLNVQACFKNIGIDANGLDRQDRKIMATILKIFKNRPVGITSLSNVMGVDPEVIESIHEPYLLNMGLMTRGPKGRCLTVEGVKLVESYGSTDKVS